MSQREVVKVHKKGLIVLPKSIRDKLRIAEGTLLEVAVEGDRIVLRPVDLWDRVWNCCKGEDVEELERELDVEEEEFWVRRRRVR